MGVEVIVAFGDTHAFGRILWRGRSSHAKQTTSQQNSKHDIFIHTTYEEDVIGMTAPNTHLLHYFLCEHHFLLTSFWFIPIFSGIQLGHKTRAGCWDKGNGKGGVVRVHTIKAYTGRRGTAVFGLNFSTTRRSSHQFHGPATLPLKKESPLFTE